MEVDQHNRDVRQRGKRRRRYLQYCTGCHSEASFAFHDLRARGLRVIVSNPVRAVICLTVLLARWKCLKCGRRFTDYPGFRTAV